MAVTGIAVAAFVAAGGLLNSHMSGEVVTPAPTPRLAATHWTNQGFARDMIRGVDVSRWDHVGPKRLSFHRLQRAGVRFVFIKASDGIPRYDAEAARWWAIDKPAAKAEHLLVGGYQYAVPTTDKSRLQEDATWKATVAAQRVGRIRRGELPLVLDLEEVPRSLNRRELTEWTLTWLRTAHALTRRRPMLYTYTSFVQDRLAPARGLSEYPLWQADWSRGRAAPPQIKGMQPASFWQFTSDGAVRGAGADRTDLDVFMGGRRALLALARVPFRMHRRYGL